MNGALFWFAPQGLPCVKGGGARPRDGGIVMQRKHNKNIVPTARMLRKNMTKEEKHLWYDFLRKYPGTNAGPLPGLQCWKSTTIKVLPSISIHIPILISAAVIVIVVYFYVLEISGCKSIKNFTN